ncbi:hypothetical protein BGZ96_003228 [Linnemannia gamsii]|uniref:CCHC-type domain-containing protein n=1 Tax=Linnemannia gamsii TaxID=64522 RepID=A0ABQ7JJH0_9FUNG|nr:hypothetical protein BGZ96_003228 [Linnemannia gamsii]
MNTTNLFTTVSQLHLTDDERASLQAAIESSLAQLITPAPVPHKPLKPSPFNGKVNAISSLNFIESLEEYFLIVELPTIKWVPYAIGYLGEARSWWRGTKRTIQNTSWIEFKETFLQQFTPADSINAARRRLHALKQSGPVLDYITAFHDLLRIIPEMDAGQKMYLFINGLERELSKQVRLSRPADLDEAIVQATVLYDILHQNEPTTNHTTPSKPEPMDIDAIFTSLNAILRNNSNRDNNNNRPFNTYATPNYNNNINNTNNNNRLPYYSNNNNNINNNRRPSQYQGNPFNPPRLDNTERERCMRLGLCLRCRQSGHLARSCPVFRLNALEASTSECKPDTEALTSDLDNSQQSGKA